MSLLSLSQTGITSLYMAANTCHLEVVKLLLDKGADVNRAKEVHSSSIFEPYSPRPDLPTAAYTPRTCGRSDVCVCVCVCVYVCV